MQRGTYEGHLGSKRRQVWPGEKVQRRTGTGAIAERLLSSFGSDGTSSSARCLDSAGLFLSPGSARRRRAFTTGDVRKRASEPGDGPRGSPRDGDQSVQFEERKVVSVPLCSLCLELEGAVQARALPGHLRLEQKGFARDPQSGSRLDRFSCTDCGTSWFVEFGSGDDILDWYQAQ
jgi:hypothetical protein